MDWRKNRVAIGAVAFLALLALTIWLVNRRDRAPKSEVALPSIEVERDAITSIQVTKPGDTSVVLTEVDGTWRVTSPLEAVADENNVKSALDRISELKINRVVASRPENYARLQVDDANAVHVVVKAKDDVVADLKVGKYANGLTMVRVADREEVFGASGSLRYAFDRELKAWRDRKIVDVDPSNVKTVRFEANGATFAFERQPDGWKATDVPKSLSDFDPRKVTSLVSMIARLTATDFAPEEMSAARAGLTEPSGKVTLRVEGEPEPIVLELGDDTEDAASVHLRRQGEPIIHLISKYMANRLRPDAKAFERIAEAEPMAPPTPSTGGERPPQLPPEVMRQLQEQIEAQQRNQ